MEKEKQYKDIVNPDKYYEDDKYSSTISYAIFRVGAKFKTVNDTSGFQAHMCREDKFDIPNANAALKYLNQNLRGGNDVVNTLKHYLSDTKPWRKNQVCARELLLTASKHFFDSLTKEELQLWINENLKFMEHYFGDNFLFGICHLDESTPHVHCLVANKHYDNLTQEWKIQAYRYFDGKQKLAQWQTDYSEWMQKSFPKLERGAMHTKAKWQSMKRLYGILENDNLDISEEDAKTKLQLQDIKIKRMQATNNNIKLINNKLIIENSELIEENKELKEENTYMHKAIKDIMITNHITQSEWNVALAKAQTNTQSKRTGS